MGEVSAVERNYDQRRRASTYVSQAIVQLASSGASLLAARDDSPPEAQELITALRDDITTMLGDVEALQSVIQGR